MKKEILSLLSMILMIYFGVAFANTYETKYLIPAMVFFISDQSSSEIFSRSNSAES